jgi:hypothetical protein
MLEHARGGGSSNPLISGNCCIRRCHRPGTASLVAQFALLPGAFRLKSSGRFGCLRPIAPAANLATIFPMKPFFKTFAFLVAVILVPFSSDALALESVPDGNYLVTVEVNGVPQRLNLKVLGNRAKCVKSADPSLARVEGQFQPYRGPQYGDRTFVARFRNGLGSQVWIFRSDGSVAIREVPDRGEQQSAIPVKNDSIEPPKTGNAR